MQRNIVLTLLILSLLVLSTLEMPTLAAVGGNNTSEQLAPDLIGQTNQSDQIVTAKEESLWMPMRTLWLENAFWTRMTIASIIQGCDNRASVQSRLMRNYQDIEETLRPYLGNETAIKYGDLIEKNNQLTVDLATAAGNKDQAAYGNTSKSLFENANSIAAFENTTLTKLSIDDRLDMWHNYLNLTKNETTQLANKDYNASIDTFDLLKEQTSMMADSLTNGIIQKSPTGFQ
ncbi:Uncharacterised protein [uncultured archaeon]|nr:Uncharacterised protein [uncultured archaeon]